MASGTYSNSKMIVEKHVLVGGFNPFEKYWSKWESSPNRGEHKKIFETTTQCFSSSETAPSISCKNGKNPSIIQPTKKHLLILLIFSEMRPNHLGMSARRPGKKIMGIPTTFPSTGETRRKNPVIAPVVVASCLRCLPGKVCLAMSS